MGWQRIVGCICLVFSFAVSAADIKGFTDPYQMVETVATQTFDRFQRDKPLIDTDVEHLRIIVEEEMMPYVDYRFAAYKVIGPTLRKTTPEQRNEFTEAFRLYMIATFARAFTQYDNQQAQFEPPSPVAGKRIVNVGVTVVDGDRPPVAVQFKARKSKKTGEWKVFDMVAEGVSLLATQEREIGGLIRQRGIEAVTKELAEKNATDLVEDGSA